MSQFARYYLYTARELANSLHVLFHSDLCIYNLPVFARGFAGKVEQIYIFEVT